MAGKLPDFLPSAFTPFARRFTDEKAQDLRDTEQLYARVRALHRASIFSGEKGEIEIGGTIWGEISRSVPDNLESQVLRAIHELLQYEKVIFELPELNLRRTHLSLKESVDLRHFLRAKEHFHANENKIAGLLVNCLTRILSALVERLPALEAPSPFTIPLIYVLQEPKTFIERLYGELWQQHYVDNGLFVDVSRRMYLNLCEVSGIANPQDPKKPFRLASKNPAPLQEIVEQYLAGTPFSDLFLARVPLQFSQEERFSHMHVVGGSGAGKTTLLQNLILNDLASEEPPALVIVDSQTDLIRKLSKLEVFDPDAGELRDRFLLITPRETKHPPALNIFDINRDRLKGYDDETKEQVTAGVIQTFDYLFSGLIGADLTAKQGVFFRFVARLMLALPETLGRPATILDMLQLMDDPAPYTAAIQSLPDIQRRFFERDFTGKTFAQTKEQIRYRLNAILENPTLARLFTSPRTKIDLFTALNDGAIVFVDTAKDFLKGSSANFGRIFISLVLQAILERAAIPEDKRRPTFLIVDEAAAYFDSNIDDLLTEARKYKLGCVFAHQFLDQATPQLRASLAANTAIKMAAGVSTGDARAMAPDMRTTADFIQGQPRLTFAAYIRNVTPSAVSIPVQLSLLDRVPQLSAESYEKLRARNRERVAINAAKPQPRDDEFKHGDGFTMDERSPMGETEDLTPHEFRPVDSDEPANKPRDDETTQTPDSKSNESPRDSNKNKDPGSASEEW